MSTSLLRGLRLLVIIPALLVGWLVLPAGPTSAAATVYVSPPAAPPGSNVQVSGQGYNPGEVVDVSFLGLVGTATASPTGYFATGFTVPADETLGTYPVTATGMTSGVSGTSNFTVTSPSTNGSSVTLSKTVGVSNGQAGTNVAAKPGDTLVYDLHYGNNGVFGTGTATTAVVTDALQGGQTFVGATGGNCSFSTNSTEVAGTVTCTIPEPTPGTSGDVIITTKVLTGFAGTIQNLAAINTAHYGNAFSNLTTVTVPGQIAPVTPISQFNGQFIICGPITGFTPPGTGTTGSVTIDGYTFTIAPNASITGQAIPTGNVCLTFTFYGTQVASIVVSPNLPGVAVVCGLMGTGPTGQLSLNNVLFPLAPGASFPIGIYPGTYYCFLFNTGNGVTGVLSTVPTFARPSAQLYGHTELMRML